MITIFHGDNFISSRNALNEIKNTVKLDAKSTTPEDLTQSLGSKALFEDEKPIIIENLLSLPQSNNKQNLIDIVLNTTDKTIYFWDKKTVTPSVKKQFKNAAIKEFKLTKTVFQFLDALKPNNQVNILKLLHQTLLNDPAELVFYFLHRRVSQLIQALVDPKELRGAPWQIGKIKAQAKNFTVTQLTSLHQKLADLDYKIKSGQSVLPLSSQLDLLFLNL